MIGSPMKSSSDNVILMALTVRVDRSSVQTEISNIADYNAAVILSCAIYALFNVTVTI